MGPDGAQIGIVSTQDALRQAQEQDLDLVEVAADARPPVCRVLDYSKWKYEQEQKAKLAFYTSGTNPNQTDTLQAGVEDLGGAELFHLRSMPRDQLWCRTTLVFATLSCSAWFCRSHSGQR